MGSTITDYFELTFWKKSRKEKLDYITWKFHKEFIYKVDNPDKIEELSDKSVMYSKLGKFLNRKQFNIKDCTLNEFKKYIDEVPKFLYKPNDESCGEGIKIIDSKNENIEKLYLEIMSEAKMNGGY